MRKSILGFLLFAAFLCRAETIKDKVLEFLPLEHDLVVISAEGDRSSDAKFTRNSNALDNKFNIVGRNLPRFAPQGGLVIENGGRSDERGAVNFLSPELADFASAGIKELDAGKAKLESVPGLQGQAISFSGTLLLKNIPLRLNKSHVFSYYAKGEGVLAVSLCVTNKSGKTTDIPVATRQLSGEWQRFYHSFKEDKDPVESLQVTFTADNAVIDSLMLEGPCIYFQRTSPSSFVSGGEWRAAELLKLPMPEELRSGETGAFSFNFTPTASGGWQDLFAIGGWWKPELDLSWYSARLQFSFRDKVVNANAAIEVGKTYHLLIQYDKNEAELFLDGKKIASIIATSKAFVSRQILLGGRIIEIKSDGIFRNFAVYRAPLGQDEIASLASMPDLSGILPRKQLSLCSKYHVFPVNIGKVRINWKTDAKLESVTASVSGFN